MAAAADAPLPHGQVTTNASGCVPGPHNPCGPWRVSEDVTLLPPNSKGGIEVITEVGYQHVGATVKGGDPAKDGLKTYNKLFEEGVFTNVYHTGRHMINANHSNYIYFRAPYHDGKTLKELYFPHSFEKRMPGAKGQIQIVTLLVDPENTYVYDSNVRTGANSINVSDELEKMLKEDPDGKRLIPPENGNSNEYLDFILRETTSTENNYETVLKVRGELKESRTKLSDYLKSPRAAYEIVVKTPVIGPEWFVRSDITWDHTFSRVRFDLLREISILKSKRKPTKKEVATLVEKQAQLEKLEADYLASVAMEENRPKRGGTRRLNSKGRRTRRKRN